MPKQRCMQKYQRVYILDDESTECSISIVKKFIKINNYLKFDSQIISLLQN